MTYYIHQTPGRMRVCTPALKNRPDAEDVSRLALRGIIGVRAVRSNPTTGSIVVTYDVHVVSPGAIINRLAAAKLLTGVIGFPAPLRRLPRSGRPRVPSRVAAIPATSVALASSPLVSVGTKALLRVTTRLILPFVAERAFGRVGRAVVSALL